MSSDHSAFSEIETINALMERIVAALSVHPDLRAAELHDALRVLPGKRAILSGTLNGAPAIFRFYLDAPEDNARRDWKELKRTETYMDDGPFRVNMPLYCAPELGLVVVTKSKGMPLMDAIRETKRAQRAGYLEPSAQWLRKYTAPTEKSIPNRIHVWLERAETAMQTQPNEALRPLEAAIFDEMRRITEPHKGVPWRVAISHGDFHPNNLLLDDQVLTGIDTGGSARLPLAKEMARFLAHMGRRGMIPSGQERLGVDAVGLEAFASVFELNEMEINVWLPAMLAFEALFRVEPAKMLPQRLARAQRFYLSLLDGLRRLG